MPDSITIVTTCMGRLHFLKRSLKTWINNTDFRIVVVDYSCPQGTGRYFENSVYRSRITVIRAAADEFDGRAIFHLAKARNIGAEQIDTGYLLFLDSETSVSSELQPWLMHNQKKDVMCVPVPDPGPSEIWGTLLVHSDIFRRIGGYDEGFVGWGSEDLDMRLRLHIIGMGCQPIPLEYLSSEPHSNELRTENYAETNFEKSRDINRIYLNDKLIRMTGRPFKSWWIDPRARRVMFKL